MSSAGLSPAPEQQAPMTSFTVLSPTADTIEGPQPQQQCLYTQLVDPNEGIQLKFVPTSIINGIRCTQIVKSDVEHEIRYWQSAVL